MMMPVEVRRRRRRRSIVIGTHHHVGARVERETGRERAPPVQSSQPDNLMLHSSSSGRRLSLTRAAASLCVHRCIGLPAPACLS